MIQQEFVKAKLFHVPNVLETCDHMLADITRVIAVKQDLLLKVFDLKVAVTLRSVIELITLIVSQKTRA